MGSVLLGIFFVFFLNEVISLLGLKLMNASVYCVDVVVCVFKVIVCFYCMMSMW